MLVEILPCQSRIDWSFISAEVCAVGEHTVRITTTCRLDAGEQVLIKLKLEKRHLVLAYDITSSRREHARTIAQGRFSGFVNDPGKLDAAVVARALAA